MPKTLPDIVYEKDNNTSIIDAVHSFYHIPYYKNEEYFATYDSYVKFVKGVERLVRTSDRYRKYINFLKHEVKLNKCQVFKDVTDEDCPIEMHHGPVFTLFDICAIVLEYHIYKKWKISTPRVADVVLMEHQMNRVPVVMVSETVHEQIHAGNIFINIHQSYGKLSEFIKKYAPAISNEYRQQLNKYIDRSLLYDSDDFGVLKLNDKLL